ncbi:Dynein assembly factor with WDR repeat domains 1 [Phytophthora citrophthora]|uniref:Dynein assembly factor with WDR repeat domains 1 n=1 Tax=Phytophthora citrophthora TaxID=4793 RepID=A0AAD9GF29_9STRA|nr:Dynein assembly factor with WDR repeat domains 1 [Phytophthora citrophthora]
MDVMMRLKGAGFSAIANAFREREKRLGGGLPLLDFVEIVLPGLPRAKTVEEKSASISALIDLFEDIDINGDGVMEFDEFTSFCVDAGMVATRSSAATLKHRYERDFDHVLKTTAATLDPTANSRSSATSSSTLNPVSTGIEKLKWSAGFRMFLVVENPARSVKIFTSEGKLVAEVNVSNEKQTDGLRLGNGEPTTGIPTNDVLLVGDGVAFVTPTTTAAPSASSISVLDAVFIVKFQWLGVSTTDFAISFYDMNDSKKVAGSSGSREFGLLKNLGLTTTTAQLTLRFCETSALLLGSGNDFIVNIWKVIDAETKILWRRLAGHTDLVLDALEIPSHDLLVSCDLRQNIRLWDITDGRARGSLVAHERGVRQLCYSQQHDLLLSAGFEFEALAWDLSSRQVALTLSGHRAPLIGVQLALFQTERAITGDCQGIFKVWDITRSNASSSGSGSSHAVQLESIDLGMPSARVEALSFICMYPSSRNLWIVTSGNCTLQHLRSIRVQQFDEVPLRAFYHYSANKFVVVAGSVCSLWDGETGSCSEEFTHVGNIKAQGVNPKGDSDPKSTHNEPGTELLACSHDAKCRKLVVVTEQGAVGVFNCQNFVQMRHCEETFMSKSRPLRRKSAVDNPQSTGAPTCAVAGVHYCSDNKLIILTDAGTSSIIIIDDNSEQESSKGIGVLRRLINIPGGISASAYSFHASMVATVAADPEGMKISLWDFETLALLGHCRYSQDGFSTTNKDGSTLSIQTLRFWDEFPILMAADSIGGVYFFAVTPLLHAFTGKLLHAFPNDHGVQTRRRRRKKSSTIPENASENEEEEEEIPNEKSNMNDSMADAAEIAARKMLLSKSLRKNALTSIPVINPPEYPVKSPMDTSSAVTSLKVVYDEANERYLLFIGDERGYVGIWDPALMIRRLSLAKIPEIKSKYLRRGYQPKTMFYRDFLKETTDVDGKKSQRDNHRQAVSHGANRDWRGAMLLGEDLEHMNIRASHMDLKRLSRRRQDSKAPRPKIPTQQVKHPSSAHVKESAVVNAVAAAEFLMTKGSTLSMPKNRSVRGFSVQPAPENPQWPGSNCHENFPHDVTLVRRWQAHMDALSNLEISRHPNVVVTCGLDMRVFVWDWEGSCLGKLFDPENQGPYPWRFRRDNIIRTKDRDVLVQDLLRELERTPAEKLELRRQSLYAEHVGRRNVNELRNVNAMLLEHIISKNPEIKMLEQDIQIKNGLEVAAPIAKSSKFRESRKAGPLQALMVLPCTTKALDLSDTSLSQSLRLQSLNQVGPLLHEESSRRASVSGDSPSFLESGDLKMDKTYLENELSITCPSSTPVRKEGNIKHQIQMEYDTAQQAIATRATLTRKAKEMYSNMEQVRNRHKARPPPSPDGIDQVGDPLEASAFLKRHFPPSALAIRPQTAPIRALTTSASVNNIRRQKGSPVTAPGLQTSASEPALPPPVNSPPRKQSSGGFNAGRRSSLDELYMEEFHRYRQQHIERDPTVSEDSPVENPQSLRPLHKLREINDIIDKVQGYCDDNTPGDQPRPSTAPVATRRSVLITGDLCISDTNNSETETLRQHLEDTKHRMQEAMRDDKRVPHRQNLRRLRLQTQQQQQRRRMHGYLQQKRRELTTNIGNVFKGLQTAQTEEKIEEIDDQPPKVTHRKSQQRSSTTGLLKSKRKSRTTAPKLVSAQKTFGMYSVQEVMSVIRLFWSMDADGSGNISMTELQQFKSVFEKLGYHNMADVFQTIDSNGDGEVSLRELLATCFHYANRQQIDGMLQLAKVGSVRAFLLGTDPTTGKEERNPFVGNLQTDHKRELMAIFRVFDHNGDGGVSMQEIMEALRVDDDDIMATVMAKEHDKAGHGRYEPVVSSGLTREDVELIYREFDRDKDATLDFDEFVAVMANLYAHKPSLHR